MITYKSHYVGYGHLQVITTVYKQAASLTTYMLCVEYGDLCDCADRHWLQSAPQEGGAGRGEVPTFVSVSAHSSQHPAEGGGGRAPISPSLSPFIAAPSRRGRGACPPSNPVSAGSSQHPAEGGGGRASFSPLVPAGGGRDDTS